MASRIVSYEQIEMPCGVWNRGPNETRIRWVGCALAPPGEYDGSILARNRTSTGRIRAVGASLCPLSTFGLRLSVINRAVRSVALPISYANWQSFDDRYVMSSISGPHRKWPPSCCSKARRHRASGGELGMRLSINLVSV